MPYSVYSDGDLLGHVDLTLGDDDAARGKLQAVPAFEPVRQAMIRAEAAQRTIEDYIVSTLHAGANESLDSDDDAAVASFELTPEDFDHLGPEVVNAMATAETISFELRDEAGLVVPDIEVQIVVPSQSSRNVVPVVLVWAVSSMNDVT
jgi:hypothetical protein